MSSWMDQSCPTCEGRGEERRETGRSWPDGWRMVAVRECRTCEGRGRATVCGVCGGTERRTVPNAVTGRPVSVCAGCNRGAA